MREITFTFIKAFLISCLIVGCSTYGLALNDFDNFNFLSSIENSSENS